VCGGALWVYHGEFHTVAQRKAACFYDKRNNGSADVNRPCRYPGRIDMLDDSDKNDLASKIKAIRVVAASDYELDEPVDGKYVIEFTPEVMTASHIRDLFHYYLTNVIAPQ
jgi:hypothetical protein